MTVDRQYASDTHRLRDLPAAVWALVAARAVNRLGAFTLPFLVVLLHDEVGVSLTTAGLLTAVFGVATIPSRLAGGVLTHRVGPVTTIVLGLVGCAVAQVGVAASTSVVSASAAVLLLGLAFELYEPPSQALVADLTAAAHRASAYGLLSAALAGAGALAGLLAAWLGGLDLRWLFVADAVSCLTAAAVVAVVVRPALPPSPPRVGDGPRGRGSEVTAGPRSPWRDRRLLLLLGCGTAFATTYVTLVTALPLTLAARGVPPARAGLLLTVSALTVVAGQPLLRWPPLRAPARALTTGYVALAAGLLATGVATTLPGLAAATVLWSVGDLLLLGHALTLVAGIAPEGARARYLAAYGLSWGVATAVAPVVATQVLATRGPLLLWGALAAVALALALTSPALVRRCHLPRAERARRAAGA